MRQHAQVKTWVLVLLSLAMAGATVTFTVLDPGSLTPASETASSSVLNVVLISLSGLAFLAVGGLISLRRKQNAVGWLCLTIGALWISSAGAGAGREWALNSGRFELAEWLGQLGVLWVPALGLMATHLPLRLPDGLLLTPGWRWYSRLCTAVIILATALIVTQPGPASGLPGTANPLAVESLQTLAPLFNLLPLTFVGAVGSLVVRYRRIGSIERLQIRVLALGGVTFVVVFIGSLVSLVMVFPESGGPASSLQNLGVLSFNAIPVAIGI